MTIRKFILEVADDGSERVKAEIEKLEREWGIEEIEAQPICDNDCEHCEWVTCPKMEAQPTSDDEIIKALKAVRTIHNGNYAPQIDEVIRRLEAQPTDAVSRELALLALTGMDLPTDGDKLIALFTERIQHLPPVTPERPKGKWIEIEDNSDEYHFECSECGQRMNWVDENDNYCCCCGAFMNPDGGE